jgi:indolepyruvate ferredoxin oxidoreductase
MRQVELDDKYTRLDGSAFMTGIQALVRLPMLQRERDRRAGLNTAGFISGYRGSPLGQYDDALRKAKQHLSAQQVHFVPGVNEDIAATSLWGTQQVVLTPEANVQGVFGIWYGKGPGVDRSMDVLKHANAAGTSEFGGVVAVMGDDHACKSSTLPHQSEPMMAAAMIPVLNPASVQELLAFGLHGFALSRYSGCWVGLKATTEVVESSAVVDFAELEEQLDLPGDRGLPNAGLGIRWPDTPLAMESRLHGPRMVAVRAFAAANPIDRVVFRPEGPQLAIVSTGKAYNDLLQAFADLGIDFESAMARGLALYKVGMSWPLEPDGVLSFIGDAGEVFVVEEKQAFVEAQLATLLVNRSHSPRLVGKRDEQGRELLPDTGELDPLLVARAVVARLARMGQDVSDLAARIDGLEAVGRPEAGEGRLARAPFFCSGCPHNISTKVPEGSRAMAGIGCHGMAYSIADRRTSFITQMGGEGAAWIGQAPFTDEPHVFQNLGDGTYFHSGLLAIRAAAAAGVNITYKILFNDAVAMTGGQDHDGPMTVPIIAEQVAAEGAKRIAIVTDDPVKHSGQAFPANTTVHHRDELEEVQKELRSVAGLTVLVYDQTCAAEKRRRSKRSNLPAAPTRVFINDLVCEGCGDCSVKSNCIAVKPLETEFGRKRRIDQSECNTDISCIEGFCPSFVKVHGGTPRRQAAMSPADVLQGELREPAISSGDQVFNILVTGIGGTGVITIGALLGMAAHLDGKYVTVLDNTGLAQKNGGVASHVRIAKDKALLGATSIGIGAADLLLACDMVVAAGDALANRLSPARTRAVVNDNVSPTSAFVANGAIDLSAEAERRRVRSLTRTDSDFPRATDLVTRLMGDSISSNLFLMGFAWQRGWIPLSGEAIRRAIELNGVAVRGSLDSFEWGRLAAHDMAAVERAAGGGREPRDVAVAGLDDLISQREAELVAYQDRRYADRYLALVERARSAEIAIGGEAADFTRAVAWNFHRLLAYKDEYEVARLYTDGRFESRIKEQFEGDFRLEFSMAPPLLARRDRASGLPRKRNFGPWMFSALKVLAKLKWLRGTPCDPFGYQAERKIERRLADDYEQQIMELCERLGSPGSAGLAAATDLARKPEAIAGFGHIKNKALAESHTPVVTEPDLKLDLTPPRALQKGLV